VTFKQAITKGFRNYQISFGRSSRSEFWFWHLFCFVGNLCCRMFDSAFFGIGIRDHHLVLLSSFSLFGLAVLLPTINIDIRRLHDVDRKGWWLLLLFTGVGAIILLFLACQKGTEGPNRWGDDPLMEPVEKIRPQRTVPRRPPTMPGMAESPMQSATPRETNGQH